MSFLKRIILRVVILGIGYSTGCGLVLLRNSTMPMAWKTVLGMGAAIVILFVIFSAASIEAAEK
ncbi:hypothetical protein J7J81_01215 [bacterium]|nr:hypothetical protein [bacterium]